MTDNQAKEILKLYRPGTADAEDPSFAEALVLCERNAELKSWFTEHCALYSALRAKFKGIPVPEGLRQQIISERKVHTVPMWQKAVLLAGTVAVLALVVWRIPSLLPQPREPHDFAHFRAYMVGQASRAGGYGMQQLTDLNQIHLFLTESGAVTNYTLPANLQKNAIAAGCVGTQWQGKQVSMLCFQTRPMPPTSSDLWLIVTDSSNATGTPNSATPLIDKTIPGITTASWTTNGKTYVLAVKGDEQLLDKFL